MRTTSLNSTAVVTAFLYRRGRVLLLKRSEGVGTYPGRWAGVSGYLERLPLEQALVEVEEEVGVDAEQLSLRGIGAPMQVHDREVATTWRIYTFLLRLKAGARTATDWESQGWEWVRPEDLGRRETVPGLAQGLARVWPPWGSDGLWRAFGEIATDTERDATELALAGLRWLDRVRPEDRRRALLAFASLRPSMGVFPHLAARLLNRRAPARRLAAEMRAAAERAAEHAAAALERSRRVLTHSASSVCRQALLRWWQPGREVVVTESRPGREGVSLARELASAGVRVTLISDAQIGLFVPRCDAVLVGADAISGEDELVNKAGTRLAAVAARESGVRCYAVAQTHKVCPRGWPIALTPQDPAKLARVRGVRVMNVAFDATPLGWFAAVFTERGPLDARLLRGIRRSLGDLPEG
jgi:translation initiation factor 2B subunit (eIF-2B alpha/beta/delta family)